LSGQIIFYALLALIPLTAIPYGTVEPLWVAVFECLVFVLGALWAIEGLFSKDWKVFESLCVLPLLALIIFALFQADHWLALSADAAESQRFALKLCALLIVGQLLLRYTTNQNRLRALVLTVIGTGLISAVFAIARQTMQRDAPGFVLPFLSANTGYGQFINKNHFAFLMEMSLGLVLGLIVGGGVRRDKVLLYVAAALPIWGALILSNSRGGIFAMLCQLLFLALMFTFVRPAGKAFAVTLPQQCGTQLRLWGRLFIIRAALIVCVVVLMFASVMWIGSDPVVSNFGQASQDFIQAGSHANVGRRDIWRGTWKMFETHPIVGVGFGGFWTAFTKSHDGSGQFVPQQAHNDYLELLASGGLIGAIIVGWFVIALIRSARQTLGAPNAFRRATCLGALAGLFAVAVHSFVDFGLHITVNALIFTVLVVIATMKLKNAGTDALHIQEIKSKPNNVT
jgi:O-antigen ligase